MQLKTRKNRRRSRQSRGSAETRAETAYMDPSDSIRASRTAHGRRGRCPVPAAQLHVEIFQLDRHAQRHARKGVFLPPPLGTQEKEAEARGRVMRV